MIKSTVRKIFEIGKKTDLNFTLKKSPEKIPHVIYAGMVPRPNAIATGGSVKLLSLAESYPDENREGNILYLVTSSLPKGALAWASACKAKGIKIVINQNGVAYPAWASEDECQRINSRNRKLLEMADYIFFQSHFCLLGVEKWVGFKPQKGQFEILYNPIKLELFQEMPPAHVDKVLIVGSHRHAERISVAIEALHILKEQGVLMNLKIAGPLAWPNALEKIKTQIKLLQLEKEIEISGPYLQSEAPSIYQSGTLLLHLQDKDASPTVPLEAMACGLQVIAPQSGGLPELIPPTHGTLIPVKEGWDKFNLPDAEAISSAIMQTIRRPKGSREILRKFCAESWVSKHKNVFETLLND